MSTMPGLESFFWHGIKPPETALQAANPKELKATISAIQNSEAARAEKHTRQHMQKGICCCAAVEKIGQNVRWKVGRHQDHRVNSSAGRASA